MKEDIRRFRKACRELGLTPDEADRFSDYVHDHKSHGELGTANERGDFTWDELLELGRGFLELEGKS